MQFHYKLIKEEEQAFLKQQEKSESLTPAPESQRELPDKTSTMMATEIIKEME